MPIANHKRHIDFRRDIFAVIFLAIGIFVGLSLISWSPTDPALNSVSSVPYVKNMGGIVGAYTADILFVVFGVSAYFTSVVFIIISILQFVGRPIRIRLREIFCYAGSIAFAAALFHLRFETISLRGHAIAGGGIIGGLVGEALAEYLNRGGAYVVSAAGLVLLFTIASKLTPRDIFRACGWVFLLGKRGVWIAISWLGARLATLLRAGWRVSKRGMSSAFTWFSQKRRGPEVLSDPGVGQPRPKARRQGEDIVQIDPIRAAGAQQIKTATTPGRSVSTVGTPASHSEAGGPKILKRADLRPRRTVDNQLKFHGMDIHGYEPPPLALLSSPERKVIEIDEETLKKNSLIVEKKLKDFNVEGRVVAIHPGPVITMYEFEPAAGTKVNKIVGLEDDLSLTLGGRSVRIVPHLPGKAVLGIEVPNNERETVWLKDILSSPQFAKPSGHLHIALGSSTSGHPVVADLTKMPHLLVAGATGSGKSVAINAMILSIIYKSSPADVRFILVDPKMLELSIYDGIPHLLLPVVTRPKPAVMAMRWAIREMERRYRLMADTGTRNVHTYNEKIGAGLIELTSPEQTTQLTEADPEAVLHTGTIPYIVIIVDELADLMMTAAQDMEDAITRLAQMARAAGIHLILATQRPSVDVITGLIKANFPARMAFKVTARHDSRTILDGIGAETLLGNGDMLFMTPQGGNLIRIHGSYVTDSDISHVVAHLREQGKPIYDESIIAEPQTGNGSAAIDTDDDENGLYDQAIKLVAETKQVSISMVQRRLRIGYNRAARLIERMEAEGIVSRPDGSKPRQVLVNNL